jgi:hypothetical protein
MDSIRPTEASFDANIMGIRPDYTIHIREDVLHEVDGPMLIHGLQGWNGQRRGLPHALQPQPIATIVDHCPEFTLVDHLHGHSVGRGYDEAGHTSRRPRRPSSAVDLRATRSGMQEIVPEGVSISSWLP